MSSYATHKKKTGGGGKFDSNKQELGERVGAGFWRNWTTIVPQSFKCTSSKSSIILSNKITKGMSLG